MSLSLISIAAIIVFLYNSIVSILSIIIVSNSWMLIFFSLVSVLIYSVSVLGMISLEIEWEDKFFKVIKTFDQKYFPEFFDSVNVISLMTLIANIIIHALLGLYTIENFDQTVEPHYETMIYIVFSTLPFYVFVMVILTVMIILFYCFIPCAIIFIFVKFVIIDTFLACRKAYREVYCDTEVKVEAKSEVYRDTEIVKSE